MKRFFIGLAVFLAIAAPVSAQSPEDMIRWVYTSLGTNAPAAQQSLWYMSAPEQRNTYFTRRMVDFYDANDTYGDDLAAACVDFGFAIPGQDLDVAEILRTLRLTSNPSPQGTTVVAEFTTFGQPARIRYDFAAEDGFWKIDDIAGDGWRVSEIACQPKSQAPAASAGYCYRHGDDWLRVDLLPDNRARIEFSSWQVNGHSCSGRLEGHQVEDGWHFPGEQSCFLRLRLGADGSLNLIDPDWACKTYMCGQRAVIDGLAFPQSSQIDCAGWRGMGD